MSPHRLPPLLLSVCLPAAAFAQVYSWKDASGKIHYGDRPPAEKQGESRKLAPPPPVTDDTEALRKAAAEKQLTEREKQQQAKDETAKTAEDPAAAKAREENCRNAKSNLVALESGQARFKVDEKGERVALDGAVRDAELARARKAVSDWCNPPKPASAKPAAGK